MCSLARNVADSYSRVQLRQTAALWRQMAHSVETLEEIERKRAVNADRRRHGTPSQAAH